jgi:hypothetical protein
MDEIEKNRYLFHWIAPERLKTVSEKGVLNPYWRHFLLEHERFARGISFCEEPMLWQPDDELPREPCIIIDRKKIDCPFHEVDSSSAYHLTKDVLRARRAKRDVNEILVERRSSRILGTPDEVFIEGRLSLDWIVAIGYEDDDLHPDNAAKAAADAFSSLHGLPTLDMTGWQVGSPGYRETDELIDEAIAERASQLKF